VAWHLLDDKTDIVQPVRSGGQRLQRFDALARAGEGRRWQYKAVLAIS
jgi:hypothetical protein